MTVITKVAFSHPDMALADTIDAFPEMRIRVIPEAGTDPEHDMYFFRLQEGNYERIAESLEEDHTVSDTFLTSPYDDQLVFGIQFTADTVLLAPQVTNQGGLALEARTAMGGWVEKWQLPDRRALHDIWEYANEESFTFDILELYRSDGLEEVAGLTDEQYKTLIEAYDRGYFEEPRTVNLGELADNLDISPSAASGRLRRGMGRLIELTLKEAGRPPD
jgi:predicted DNA binding protein